MPSFLYAAPLTIFFLAAPYAAAQFSEPVPVMYSLGGTAGEFFGDSVAAIGDVDGDGTGDFIAGAPFGAGGGRAVVFSGRTGSVVRELRPVAGEAQFGWEVAGGVDFDEDGHPDFLVTAPQGATGVVAVYSGATMQRLYTIAGAAAGDRFGERVAITLDLSGDRIPDIVTGAQFADPSGRIDAGIVYVHSGTNGTPVFSIPGEAAGDKFGSAVCGLADVDGDATPDLAVGAYSAGASDTGRLYIISGRTRIPLRTVNGETTGGAFARHYVAAIPDTDHDGINDIITADFAHRAAGNNTGRAYVISGATGSVINTLTGSRPESYFGTGARGAGDLDSDGTPDLFVGAAFEGSTAGKAYFFSGRDHSLLFSITGTRSGATLGARAIVAGDLNGDGRGEILLTAPTDGTGGNQAGRVHMISGAAFPKAASDGGLYFHPVPPCRVSDSRTESPITADTTRAIQVSGRCGVPAAARAISANFTVTNVSGTGYLSIYPEHGFPPRPVSTLNFDATNWALANAAITPLRDDGGLTAFAAGAAFDLIVDVNGYFADRDTGAGLLFHPLLPCRTHDTREQGGILGDSTPRSWTLAHRCGTPPSARAVSANLTITGQTSNGYVRLYPEAGQPLQESSVLNFSAAQWALANAAIVPLRAPGALTVMSHISPAHAILDVNGYFGDAVEGGLRYFPLAPCRVFDTRESTLMEANSYRDFLATGICGVPPQAVAVAGNFTVTGMTGTGYLSVYTEEGAPRRPISTINFSSDQWALANAAIVPLREGGRFTVFSAGSAVHVIFDVSGYFR